MLAGVFQISNTTRFVPNGFAGPGNLRRNRSLTALNRQGGNPWHIGVGVLDQPWRGVSIGRSPPDEAGLIF